MHTGYFFTLSTNRRVFVAIPERCPIKFTMVRSAFKMDRIFPCILKTTLFRRSFPPLCTRNSNLTLGSTILKISITSRSPQKIPFSLAITRAEPLACGGTRRLEVISPRPVSSLSASLKKLSVRLDTGKGCP